MKRCKQERGRSWGKTKKKEEKKGNVRSQEVCKNVTGERGGGGGGVCGGV